MLARVADHNSPAAQPVPTSSHSTSLLQNPVMPVLDHRISPLLNPMHCSPTPPNSSTNTPTPPVAFNRMGKVNVMQIRCKFGQLGTYKGQFSSPHGFCLGMDEEIVIADTNNHRICVYDKAGEFKHSFGIAGKDEGQLWYPRKVSILIVTMFVVSQPILSFRSLSSGRRTHSPLHVMWSVTGEVRGAGCRSSHEMATSFGKSQSATSTSWLVWRSLRQVILWQSTQCRLPSLWLQRQAICCAGSTVQSICVSRQMWLLPTMSFTSATSKATVSSSSPKRDSFWDASDTNIWPIFQTASMSPTLVTYWSVIHTGIDSTSLSLTTAEVCWENSNVRT